MRRTAAFLCLCLFPMLGAAAAPLRAQAPTITSAGDPSVRDDTLYALAVDPAEHADESTAVLLDDGVVRFEADGTGTYTYRTVVQVLKKEAVADLGELTFGYRPDTERFRLNWVRVVDAATGDVVTDEPLQVQETDVPAPEGAPVYTRAKRVRVSLSGVAAGRILDYSYTREITKPVLEGDFWATWFINAGSTIRRSRLVLDLPADLHAHIHEIDVHPAASVRRAHGRVVRTWTRADLAKREVEPFRPDSDGVLQHIVYGGAISWPDIARWYDSLAAGRYAATPALDAKLAELVGGAKTLDDSVRAVHRWIAQDVRYVSLSLGIGGYQPRPPDEVIRTLSGDCKDKATLFIAMARRMGLEAYPVLTTTSLVDSMVPSISQFDHAIAAVEMPDGRVYTDLTAELVPFGALPGGLHGSVGLVAREDGSELVVLPDPPATDSRLTVSVVGELDDGGAFHGTYREVGTGLMQYGLRSAFAEDMNGDDVRRIAQNVAAAVFHGGTADTLLAFDGRDLGATPELTVPLEAPRATSLTPEGDHIMTMPLEQFGNSRLLRYLESADPRVSPFDVGAISGDNEEVQELRLTLPEGWSAVLPPNVTADSRFGTYTAKYTQVGRELRVTRHYVGKRGIAGPETQDELIGWMRTMLTDDPRYIVIRSRP